MATTITFAGSQGVSNDTTDVVMTAAIGSLAQLIVQSITVYNKDTSSATVTIKYANGVTERIIVKQVLTPGSTLDVRGPIILSTSGATIEMVLDGAVAANPLEWTISHATLT